MLIPHYWKKVKVTNSLVKSDHKAIIAYMRDSKNNVELTHSSEIPENTVS